jgi:hypothetical protein
MGGRATIDRVEEGPGGIMVGTVESGPDVLYGYAFLLGEQERLRERFGDRRAHRDPDYRPEFNRQDPPFPFPGAPGA